MSITQQTYITVTDLARQLEVCKDTIYDAVARGAVNPDLRVGRRHAYLFLGSRVSELAALLRADRRARLQANRDRRAQQKLAQA